MRWPHQACSCQMCHPDEVMLPAAVSTYKSPDKPGSCSPGAAGSRDYLETERGLYKFSFSSS